MTSSLGSQLDQEWAQLAASAASVRMLRRWKITEPVLTAYSDLDQVRDAVWANQDVNEIIAGLLRLFQAGRQLAGRVLLQICLPMLTRQSVTIGRRARTTEMWQQDRLQLVIAEFWSVLEEYPVGREHRRQALLRNLRLETLHRVTSSYSTEVEPSEVLSLSDGMEEVLADGGAEFDEDVVSSTTVGAEDDLLRVLSWAIGRQVITGDEAQMLRWRYADSERLPAAEVAARLGVSRACVRKRCERLIPTLVAAVRAEFEAGLDLASAGRHQVA